MKSVTLTRIFAVIGCAAILHACKKDENNEITTPTPVPDSTYVISRAYYYAGDSTGTPSYVDTVYYNNDKIARVAAVASLNDSINYLFTYNTAGKMTQMSAKGTGVFATGYKQFYHFYYNTNNRLDSLRQIDSTQWQGNYSYTMAYDDNNRLKTATIFDRQGVEPVEFGNFSYIRNAAGKIDTITHLRFGDILPTSLEASTDTTIRFSDAYNMVLAVRASFILFGSNSVPKLNFTQLLNPSDYVFRNGLQGNQPFSVNYTKNGLGLLNSYWLKYSSGESRTHSTIRFEYIKVPKN
ncbi:hypothetical protein [Chitinophaga rhizophila]|uniref:YD repeat-containing protein n=1 Tax=Chitinophaga rhizophila TaxID=2866212 RepID=A0ABS7G759_9BACT|nr:hypothetical protein [Chitinophaga rhizophila]MBW8683286.1 hypothetical protein [Chitinophaga rhizophila]